MTPDIEAAITQAATQNGIDPAFALAVAERESNGNPAARASRTIQGLFQMSAPLRTQYGIGNSLDPAVQAQGWARFINDTRGELAQRLGRQPTYPELYLAHYFGEPRAAQIIGGQTAPQTDVRDVFTPTELAENPEIARAGQTGNLVGSITGDISRRMAQWGDGQPTNGTSLYNAGSAQRTAPDFASFGEPQDANDPDNPALPLKSTTAQAVDFASFGVPTTGVSGAGDEPPPVNVPPPPQQSGLGPMPSGMTLTRERAQMSNDSFDPGNVSAPIDPGTPMPDEEFGGTDMRDIRGTMNVVPGADVDFSQFGAPQPQQPASAA